MAWLGFRKPYAANLTSIGLTATWTPDDGVGGALSISIPAGGGCGGSNASYEAVLSLARSKCAQKFRFEVSGPGSKFNNNPVIYVYDPKGEIGLKMWGPGGGLVCASGDLVTVEGTHPADLKAGCGGDFEIIVVGNNGSAPALSITVTVTEVPDDE